MTSLSIRSAAVGWLAVATGLMAMGLPRGGHTATVDADQIKAAYVYNFAKFVSWPESAPADVLTICFVGAAAVRDFMRHDVDGKQLGTRRIAVRNVDPDQAVGDCGILYLESNWAGMVARSSKGPVYALTVSDAADFTEHGGMIGLFTDGGRMRFSVNLDNARQAGLKLSSNLLQLASKVEAEAAK